jgi:pimeloyl-ACP methyl ester carboxylesterase
METRSCGFRLQRHIDAIVACGRHFEISARAILPTGITVEYTLHKFQSKQKNISENEYENVVMIMGFATSREAWGYTLEHFNEKWTQKGHTNLRIVTFDNRGIGKSDVPFGKYSTLTMAQDTKALIDHLGWTKAHIVGVSMGGMISLEFAHTYPECVQSLSLFVTTRGRFFPNLKHIVPLSKLFLTRDPTRGARNLLVGMYPPEFLDRKMEDREETVREVLEVIHFKGRKNRVPPTLKGILGQFGAVFSHYVSDKRLQEINAHGFPILIVGGRHDIMVPIRETEKLSKILKGDHVRTLIYEDAGHGMFIQYGEEVVDELIQHLQKAMAISSAAIVLDG